MENHMKILVIGDVTSLGGVKHLERSLWRYRDQHRIDLVLVNAENAGFITGPSPEVANRLFDAGADCLTGGNHTLRARSIWSYIDEEDRMLRPINFGSDAPGQGYTVLDVSGRKIMVINAMGNVHIEPNLDSPFDYIERALVREEGKYELAILDIHAEATGEKLAIAHAFDGKIGIVYGTHTHVQTADEQILPRGTAYITDVGMCGESGGILGMAPDSVVARMRSKLPLSFEVAKGAPVAEGAVFTVDERTMKVTNIERVKF